MRFNYDVIIIGGGHAGCEAATAAARLGARTCLITMDMNKIAQMSCNPAVGGIAKGQIVRELDALGGEMGRVTDATTIQFRMLNRGKGPAVWSPRAQCDREKFIWKWRETLDGIDGLDIWQDQVEELLVEPFDGENSDGFRGIAVGVRTVWGVEFRAKSIVVTAGTFLNGLLHVGRRMVPGGRMAEPAVTRFTESITRWGIRADRMKTGTPVRIDRRSVDFSLLEEQPGENDFHQFSYMEKPKNDAEIAEKSAKIDNRTLPQLSCWLLNTNARVHEILRTGLDDSPLYNGQIQSIGPRYCPSIETKLVTFPDREQHPLFLEPEGIDTNEMYLNGFSSSMPIDIQLEALRQIPALRDVKIYRPGYAIEYDFFDPTQLNHSMESKILSGLFFAGQVNGTTGYEEAAGQGLMAGVNAAFHSQINTQHPTSNTQSFTLARDEAYIGVLIDDLVTKGVDEPYRMFTSRAEYRILLRQDDADARLTERAYEIGLASRERYDWWLEKKENIEKIVHFCENTPVKPREINGALENLGTTPLQFGCKIADLIARPQLSIAKLAEVIPELKTAILSPKNRQEEIAEAAEIRIKYKGYIEREKLVADKMHRLENIRIKDRFKYAELHEISTEARQKLERIKPETLAQASRIPGVSPSDINVLLVLLGR
ncbi:MAG: tRNA uridine-5-carboxymethylaminomethyl(34) synthesis enzyme MnmG [Prevotella sp.]|nr:tRNA uridine-5-carboxymethylaminomethyl(34) synthesis enzyme MnmG [Prevotella sp.]